MGAADIRSELPALQTLHQALPGQDPISEPGYFLSRQAPTRNLPVVAMLGGCTPFAAVLFSAGRKWGVPTGLLRGGNSAGDGVLISPGLISPGQTAPGQIAPGQIAPGQTAPVRPLDTLAEAIAAVFRIPWVHTVYASLRGEQADALPPALAGFDTWRRYSHVGTDLLLDGGFEGFLSRLRPRSRRNYRYFRRRAEEGMNISFVPALADEDGVAAVSQLHDVGMYPLPHVRSLQMERAIRQTPGSFAMGLRLPDGRWLSYLGGWRRPGVTYVELQLNDHRHPAASLSTVMRTCLIEHEAAQGVKRIVFVGGSTDALGRYCEPARSLDLLVMRKGLRGWVAKTSVRVLSPDGTTAAMLRSEPLRSVDPAA